MNTPNCSSSDGIGTLPSGELIVVECVGDCLRTTRMTFRERNGKGFIAMAEAGSEGVRAGETEWLTGRAKVVGRVGRQGAFYAVQCGPIVDSDSMIDDLQYKEVLELRYMVQNSRASA
jgi:hypothetical protein